MAKAEPWQASGNPREGWFTGATAWWRVRGAVGEVLGPRWLAWEWGREELASLCPVDGAASMMICGRSDTSGWPRRGAERGTRRDGRRAPLRVAANRKSHF